LNKFKEIIDKLKFNETNLKSELQYKKQQLEKAQILFYKDDVKLNHEYECRLKDIEQDATKTNLEKTLLAGELKKQLNLQIKDLDEKLISSQDQ